MGNIAAKDDRLWARSLQGEGEAFGALFDRHRDRVFRHAFRLSGDRHDAEDIMSTVFLELWRRRQKVRLVEGSVLPWLLVTTTNISRNSGRAARRYRGLLDSLPRSEDARRTGESSDVPEAVDRNVAPALGTLNGTDLSLVSLVVFEDYSLADAAAVLNMTAGAAKTRIHRARQRMKAAISGAAGPAPTAVVEGKLP